MSLSRRPSLLTAALCLLALPMLAGACSSKRLGVPSEPRAEETPQPVVPTGTFFSDLQILVEVKAAEGPNCDSNSAFTVVDEQDFTVAREANQLLSNEDVSGQSWILNLRLQTIGFDRVQIKRTLLASGAPKLPYGLSFWRRGSQIEMRYLNERFLLNLRSTPIYSLAATEQRGDCTITHAINVFSENSGF